MVSRNEMRREKGFKIWRFFVFSALGLFLFFVPVTMSGTRSIMLDHIVTVIHSIFGENIQYYTLAVVFAGTLIPILTKTWKKSAFNILFTIFKILGLVIGVMAVFNIGPAFVLDENMGPFLYYSLAINLSLLIPLGGAALGLILGYGFLVFIGVLLEPVMRKLFKTPGRSAMDAMASLVGSYSVGLLITNRTYKEGLYNKKEGLIIATGFSTVSVTIMVVVARTLDLMDHWVLFFIIVILVTFLVTALTAYLPPIRNEKEIYFNDKNSITEEDYEGNILEYAWYKAKQQSHSARPLREDIWTNFLEAMKMTASVVPSVLSIGLLGLIIAEYTDVITWISYVYYPLLYMFPLENVPLIAEAVTISIVEMFLPSLLAAEADIVTRFIAGVTSISAVVFLSGLVPAVLSTSLNLQVWKLIAVWFIRTVLSLLIVIPIALLIF
ncbi:YjiH family protein [Jeotgalicoccus nanhaiensis]|uniref:YjiH family protein n=1 Tax=Jeotgalicoccus nanhaiensis TaxID=568603 RepID=A0ABR9XXH2_9STAP|nr:YjiH family protein [Jeotgalicoccus nanhaiensis]MBF0753661.1 YjiH family protein [Jeotgalicoccus nanhaiensis]TFU61826.1 YjiH family protein [Jeotgalicoccus nanhaiensis]